MINSPTAMRSSDDHLA